MPTCPHCGGEIIIRYMGGRPTPIHLSGGWCSGSGGSGALSAPASAFRTFVSYVNPNARCPVCHEPVFFYQSPQGGRVFFDDLGWPWPKHPCTDNSRLQGSRLTILAASIYKPFRNAEGEPLDLYELTELVAGRSKVEMRFSKLDDNRSFRASVTIGYLREQQLTVEDLRSAPSFVVRTYDSYRILEFISGRKKQIASLRLKRPKRQT